MDKARIRALYRFGFDRRDFRLMFPGVPVEAVRRVIVAAAATANYGPVPADRSISCSRCGEPTCGGQGMKTRYQERLRADWVTLEWLQID